MITQMYTTFALLKSHYFIYSISIDTIKKSSKSAQIVPNTISIDTIKKSNKSAQFFFQNVNLFI